MIDNLVLRNLGIDLLRVISICIVVFSHFGMLSETFLDGTHGVLIFFMVSGYCMGDSINNRSGGAFLVARFFRLIPAFLVCVTITEFIEFALPEVRPDRWQTGKEYLANLACLPTGNLLCDAVSFAVAGKPVAYRWVDGAYWSLLVEIRFYLLLWALYYGLKVKMPLIPIAVLGVFGALNAELPISKGQDFLSYLSFFAFGMAYRRMIMEQPYAIVCLLLAFSVFTLNCLFSSKSISLELNIENYASYTLCFATFVVIMLIFGKAKNRIVGYFGLLTYPVYLLHQDIGLILIQASESRLGHPLAASLAIAISLVVSIAVHHLIEIPAGKVRTSVSARFFS